MARRLAGPRRVALALSGAGAGFSLLTLGLVSAGAGYGFVISAAAAAFAAGAGALGAGALEGQKAPVVHRHSADEDGAWLFFDKAGEVAEASGAVPKLLGLPAALLLGTGLFERLHVADRVAFLCALSSVREGGKPQRLSLRLRLPRTDSAVPPGYRTLALGLRAEGEAIVGTLRDEGAVERLEAELASARESTRQSEKRRGDALAAAGHELRTPLNAIIGFSEMLGRESLGGFSDPRQRDYADLIRQSGLHMMGVLDNILQACMAEAGARLFECKPFAVAEAVEQSCAMVRLAAEAKGVRVAVELAPCCGVAQGDVHALQQILLNLLSNAVKYTPAGGEVRIGGQRIGTRLQLWVRDTGIGMAQEDLARIGRPYVRVGRPDDVEGCGLGLSLVRSLVEALDGTLSVESAPGKGTLATVGLPVDLSQISIKPEVIHAQGADAPALRKTA